ncbi:histidine kinase [Mucilaginibacter sp. CSA2-8R]|uniref:sensor histidine kinase n=1 Tax=Mucilaginibacter sp. CSA2-8R TaxID=3141542 RepID=UPI00315D4B5C
MKKLLIIFLLIAGQIAAVAQTHSIPKVSTENSFYDNSFEKFWVFIQSGRLDSGMVQASSQASEAELLVTKDKYTKWVWEHNPVANQALTNYVFSEGTKTTKLYIAVPEVLSSFYRYDIFDDDGKSIITGGKLNGKGIELKDDKIRHTKTKWVLFDLGRFEIANKVITVEYYNYLTRNQVTKTVLHNKPLRPAQLFFTSLLESEQLVGLIVTNKKRPDGFAFKLHDSTDVKGVLLYLIPTSLTFIYHVYLKNLETGKKVYVGNNWKYEWRQTYPSLIIDAAYFRQPGNYEVSIVPALYFNGAPKKSFTKQTVKTHFTVLPSDKTYTRKQLWLWLSLGILTVSALAATVIALQKRRHARRIAREQTQKAQAQMQLSTVRAQLNPHFVFNALAGIQNLMNSQQTDQANRYLSRFARLTRNVLYSAEFVTLTDELALLNDYLEMEKLRFGFTYHLQTDPQLDTANLEIPAMLLQPLVENAVKHGVASLSTDGLITLEVQKQADNVLISVMDNGKGFDNSLPTGGLGLKLTGDRIRLLNELHPGTPISMDITTPETGTRIIITLNHWL